jgi:hypothetical protein
LLEVLLASAIGLLILGGVYLALDMQLRYAESGRAQVAEATLVRTLMRQINADVTASIGLSDPSTLPGANQSSNASGGSGGSGSTSPTSGSTSPSTTTPSTGGSGSGGSSSPSSSTTTTSTAGQDNPSNPMRAVFGDEQSLRVWVSGVPASLTDPAVASNTSAPPASDQRVVQYWLSSNGLCRQEVSVVTNTADQVQWAQGGVDEARYIIAPEVTEVAFRYWDGSNWQTTWNSTDPGADNMTPQGPPAAIEVTLTLTLPGVHGSQPRVRKHRHVINIPTANGQPQQNSTQNGQSGQSGQSGSSGTTQPGM